MCAPEALDPFNADFKDREGLAVASLQTRVQFLRSQGRTEATVGELRPGADMSENTKAQRFLLPTDHILPAVTLHKHEFVALDNSSKKLVAVHTDMNNLQTSSLTHTDLSETGGVCICRRDQPTIDFFMYSPSPFMLWSQARNADVFNAQSGATPEHSCLKTDEITPKLKEFRTLLAKTPLKDTPDVFEYITNRSLSNKSFTAKDTDRLILIHAGNWKSVMGPVFSQRWLPKLVRFNHASQRPRHVYSIMAATDADAVDMDVAIGTARSNSAARASSRTHKRPLFDAVHSETKKQKVQVKKRRKDKGGR